MLARVYALLGVMRTKLVRYPDAIASFNASIEALPHAAELTPAQRAEIYTDRAHAYRYNGQFNEAEADLAQALTILFPDGEPDWEGRPNLAALQAVIYQNRNRFEDAERFFAIATRGYQREGGEQLALLGALLSHRISMLASMQRLEEVLELADTMIELSDSLSGNARMVQRHNGMFWKVRTLASLGRADEAAEHVPDLVAGFAELHGIGSPQHGSALQLAGHVYRRAGRTEEGVQALEQAIPMIEAAYGRYHYEVEKAYDLLSNALKEHGDGDEYLRAATRHKLLRLYVAGPGEGDSVRQASREAVELFGLSAWRKAMTDEYASLNKAHPKRARFGAYVAVALDSLGDETVDLVALARDAASGIAHAERSKEVVDLFAREVAPITRTRGTPDDAREIMEAVKAAAE
jgi:tetratricopeptide (TPR) repeat protein